MPRQRGPAGINYRTGDARDLAFLTSDSFDAAACVLAIQNIHPIAPVFATVSRLLQARGTIGVGHDAPLFSRAERDELGMGCGKENSVPACRSVSASAKVADRYASGKSTRTSILDFS